MPRPRRAARRSASFLGSGACKACSLPIRPSTGSACPGPMVIIAVAAHPRIRVPCPGAVIMGRVLLVDDDPVMILDQVTHALGPRGIRVDVAHTAQEGLRQVATQPPDVILLDVH